MQKSEYSTFILCKKTTNTAIGNRRNEIVLLSNISIDLLFLQSRLSVPLLGGVRGGLLIFNYFK